MSRGSGADDRRAHPRMTLPTIAQVWGLCAPSPVLNQGFGDDHVGRTGAQLVEFLLTDYPFEYVEALFPIGVHDVGMKPAAFAESDRPPIVHLARAVFSAGEIVGHVGCMVRTAWRADGSASHAHAHISPRIDSATVSLEDRWEP